MWSVLQAITYDKDENYSGVLIMMYAKRIVEGKPLSFEQVNILLSFILLPISI